MNAGLTALFLALATAGCAAQPVSVRDDPRPAMTLRDLISLPRLSDPRIGPDGRYALYSLSQADWARDEHVSHIWRVDLTRRSRRRMTNGAGGESQPRWSPDGDRIAFLAKRGDDAHPQIYMLYTDGGEARRISAHPTGITDFEWGPLGKRLYFLANDPATKEQEARKKRGDTLIRFEEKPFRHLWRLDLPENGLGYGATSQITEGAFTVRNLSVADDGTVLYDRYASSRLEDLPTGELWTLSPEDGKTRQITRNNRIWETKARLSPDGTRLLYVANADAAGNFYYNDNLFVLDLTRDDAQPRLVLPDMPYAVREARWTREGDRIVFRANTGVRDALFRVSLEDERVETLTDRAETVSGWSYDRAWGRHVVSLAGAVNAGDLWRMDPDGAMMPLTDHYAGLQRRFRLPRQEVIAWRGRDGERVEGILTYPVGYEAGDGPVPLIVNTHGGPAATDQVDGFSDWEYLPVAAAQGYAVLRPNYRGSTGYGDAFLRNMVGGYFDEAHHDVLAGVDALVERGIADPDRLIKMGWSAGGHMTNKIITFTDRFAAASSGAGAVNWISMYGQSDIRFYRTPWFGGSPWDRNAPIETFWRQSPLSDIHKVTTPTLILVGEDDDRVPASQSVELFRALRHHDVPTKLVMAPKEGHSWSSLKNRLYKANLELDWFARHALGRAYEWEVPPGLTGLDGERAGAASR